jgi:hypothetical protein
MQDGTLWHIEEYLYGCFYFRRNIEALLTGVDQQTDLVGGAHCRREYDSPINARCVPRNT